MRRLARCSASTSVPSLSPGRLVMIAVHFFDESLSLCQPAPSGLQFASSRPTTIHPRTLPPTTHICDLKGSFIARRPVPLVDHGQCTHQVENYGKAVARLKLSRISQQHQQPGEASSTQPSLGREANRMIESLTDRPSAHFLMTRQPRRPPISRPWTGTEGGAVCGRACRRGIRETGRHSYEWRGKTEG